VAAVADIMDGQFAVVVAAAFLMQITLQYRQAVDILFK
jgi:hypothetical protein